MGRKSLPETKVQIASRVSPAIKVVIDAVAKTEKRTPSQVIEILLEESPRVKAKIQANGKAKK